MDFCEISYLEFLKSFIPTFAKTRKNTTLQEDQHSYVYKFLALIRLHNSDRRRSRWRDEAEEPATPGVVSWQAFHRKGWVHSRTSTCEICGGQSGIGTGICPGSSTSRYYQSTNVPMESFFLIWCSYQKDQWRSLRMPWKVLSLSRQAGFPVGHELRPMKKVYGLNITSVYDWYFVVSETSIITNHKPICKKREKFIACVT